MTGSKEQYDTIDFMKFICAVLIVILHTNPLPKYESIILPITHIAVPFFFIVGAFFTWKKLNAVCTRDAKNIIIKKYIKGIMALYFTWFVITLPVTLYTRRFFAKGLLYGIAYFCREFFLHSTWRSSWYLMATIIGTLLTYYFCEIVKINEKLWLAIVFFIYMICIVGSTWGGILYRNETVWRMYLQYIDIFTVPYTSFPVSLFWIYVGKWLAAHETDIVTRCSLKNLYLMLFFSLILLLLEAKLAYGLDMVVLTDDCYLSLIPVAIVCVCIGLLNDCHINNAGRLRKISTLTYCMQGSLVEILGGGAFNCALILFGCLVVSCVCIYCEDRKRRNGVK